MNDLPDGGDSGSSDQGPADLSVHRPISRFGIFRDLGVSETLPVPQWEQPSGIGTTRRRTDNDHPA